MRKERVEIKKLGINGEGIGYIEKKICFIQDALPGEIVDVEIIERTRQFTKGKVVRYIQKSPYRQPSVCKEYTNCQGCALTTLEYSKHLSFKKGLLKDALKKYTHFDVERLPIQKTIKAPETLHYRQVVSLPITYFKGKVHAGIFQRETKYLTLMNQCSMQDSLINICIQKIEDILNEHHVRDYNDKVKKGLRFMRMRNIDGQIQVLFVTGQDGMKQEVINDISQIPEVKSIWYTINTTRYQQFEMQGYKKAYGQSYLPFQCFDQKYLYSIKSEFPVYPQMEKIKLDTIRSLLSENSKILSLNCGIGLLELSLKQNIVAVDEKNYHIHDAKENAKFLVKDNVQWICQNVHEACIQQCKKNHFDEVIVRSSELSDAFKQSFILSKIKHIIYVSDHPSSLAKGLEELDKYYRIEKIIPIDTYPYSAKFDTVVSLIRK